MSKVIVIDGGNAQFRAIFGYMGQYNTLIDTEISNALEKDNLEIDIEQATELVDRKIRNMEVFLAKPTLTYCRMLAGYIKKIGIDENSKIIVAQDYGSWRKEIDPFYKAQRQEDREKRQDNEWWDKRYSEFNKLYEDLSSCLPWYFLKSYKVESDDWASVVCRYYTDKEVVLVSSDKDWEMLLDFNNVKIFSPISKKYKKVPNPMKVLLEKIQGDVSDNLLKKPSNEKEWENRKKIVDLIHPLPDFIEFPLKETLEKLTPKPLLIEKVPYKSFKKSIKQIYFGEK